ncbi:MAG: SAM-dependent methyltransferase [Sandaracinus sp.]|nr:SAM-dependent methyltransferase [Sandaracinus sp.]|tara:strand:- start:1243 stop:1857 length:615 start_codon:yes stop_codon:yes gene_type:complete
MSDAGHWEEVYATKAPDGVSWYRPHLDRSLALIEGLGPSRDARIVDVGGGASTLVDDLLDRGFQDLAVVDLATAALAASRARLGDRATAVEWIVGDARHALFPVGSVDLWHDRAVFHFLTEPADRAAYVDHLALAVRPGGHAVIATFAEDGPEKCSGLPVVRHSPDALAAAMGDRFEALQTAREVHRTPWGSEQPFAYVVVRRR